MMTKANAMKHQNYLHPILQLTMKKNKDFWAIQQGTPILWSGVVKHQQSTNIMKESICFL